ncbi:hypothetical protein ME7_01416 [Bartonella birtlesii LL-WM9]|uniref:Uncharacterized protein n=1 Tax=Bartonella birtlesii LL-WM9 TaxID=1094552 RepID=J0YJP9_9HYPH|nr:MULTISPECIES: hypothetical protein [Bartonella]EJF74778.1 hypothetical protein ME7_01416 [Bartonella birtlesii LL-WM9]
MSDVKLEAGRKSYHVITEQQRQILESHDVCKRGFSFIIGIILGVASSIFIMTPLNGGDWKNWTAIIVAFILFIWLCVLNEKVRSVSDKIWQDIKQESGDISEKKQKEGTP